METTLKAARGRRKWDQQTLAARSGVSQATISRLEAGTTFSNPTTGTVIKLEQALGLRRGTLVFGQVMAKAS